MAREWYPIGTMNEANLNRILRLADAKEGKEGERELTEGRRLTLYAAHAGVSLTVARVEGLKVDAGEIVARNDKGERYFLSLESVFAVSVEANGQGAAGRKAGFM